jgi:nicotinate-nucleotide--dimethylbenzimidazole phosphoribosyltransferase
VPAVKLDGIGAVLFDVGGTLVAEAPPSTPVGALEVRPLPGVVDVLAALAVHHRLGAVTNTSVMREADVRALLARAGIDAFLEALVTSVDAGTAKPDPAPITEAVRRLGVDPRTTLYVGDRRSDAVAAQAAGVHFVAVDAGLDDALDRVRAVTGRGAFATAARAVRPIDKDATEAARTRHGRLTKPPGSLGQLEDLGVQLAGIAGVCPPPLPAPAAIAVFAGDHGVAAAGVTSWPSTVTAQMLANFAAGGAAINAIARQAGATLRVVDVGVATDVSHLDGIDHRNVRRGTADLSRARAMTVADAITALDVGVEVATELVRDGARLLVTGDMGIGNTTPSAALIAAFTARPAAEVTGRGTGIDDAMLARKTGIVAEAVARTDGFLDPISVLAEVGGLEIAALAGFVVGGAAKGVPVLVDGVIACAALLVADALVPGVRDRCIAGHRSREPGAGVALDHLGLEPVLTLDLRLGEGSGAALAIPIVQSAVRVLVEMATFEDAGIGAT